MKYLVQLHPDASDTFFEEAHINVIHHYETIQQYLVELDDEIYSLLIHNPDVLHIERDHNDNSI
ncbi:hypothetical protein ETI05_00555 [Macrococcoides canis]|uniref:hypothetical protein n=1 Tax=Macrococcoides canis TaxID=1855823 RepID=UPI00105DB980|nr:hypothetical protein [Macrococcus canis]TDM21261.1 hypothetical protein ETI05_00555 [Macrococcus canis]TDM23897.1 hypothetical protein ETI02_05720 [Macrococcus canis]